MTCLQKRITMLLSDYIISFQCIFINNELKIKGSCQIPNCFLKLGVASDTIEHALFENKKYAPDMVNICTCCF